MDGLHFIPFASKEVPDDLENNFESSRRPVWTYLCIKLNGSTWVVVIHHRDDYDVDLLISEIKRIKKLTILKSISSRVKLLLLMLAICHRSFGYCCKNGMEILVLDASATCHMPDVPRCPIVPLSRNGFEARKKPILMTSSNTPDTGYRWWLHWFKTGIANGERLYLEEDMAIYSIC